MKGDIHVVPRSGVWEVQREGVKEDPSVHMSQAEALVVGREIAIREDVELVIHDPFGSIRDLAASSQGVRVAAVME